ncbi:MAG: efflux RND transporter periplasmic adaptor subunit [Chloroflexi bacterium]|nr:efflux RND transporter periplasmic adaptor subunit [Chloroflexota bacterium]
MRRFAVPVLLTAVAALAACNPFAQESKEEIQLARVTRGNLVVTVSGSGTLAALREAKLTFATGGRVEQVFVKEGDNVSAGAPLARLDIAALELALARAEAAQDEAKLALLQAQGDLEQAKIAFEQARVNRDQAMIARDQIAYDLREMEKTKNISEDLLRIVRARLEAARSQLAVAEAQLAFAASQLEPVELRLSLAQSQERLAGQSLALNQKQLDEATITAPFDGVVARIDVKERDTVSTSTVVVHLIDPKRLEMEVEVDEIDVTSVTPQQKVSIEVDALPGTKLEGRVSSIGLLPAQASGIILYEVKVAFDAPSNLGLRTGMSANADIIVSERENVLLVPERAITRDGQGKRTVMVRRGEVEEEREVIAGASDGTQTEIVRGVEEGEMVVERRGRARSLGPLFQ